MTVLCSEIVSARSLIASDHHAYLAENGSLSPREKPGQSSHEFGASNSLECKRLLTGRFVIAPGISATLVARPSQIAMPARLIGSLFRKIPKARAVRAEKQNRL